MSTMRVASASLIASGAALVGAMSGWELGPCRVEVSQDQLALFGAAVCGVLGVATSSLAVERKEAIDKRRHTIQRLGRVLFQVEDKSGQPANKFEHTSDSKSNSASSDSLGGIALTNCGARS
jgi:hypothetical protein